MPYVILALPTSSQISYELLALVLIDNVQKNKVTVIGDQSIKYESTVLLDLNYADDFRVQA